MNECLDISVNKNTCCVLTITPECKSAAHNHATATSAAFWHHGCMFSSHSIRYTIKLLEYVKMSEQKI